jgi:hypothetical protein
MEELDYGNFKATIPHSDPIRHDAYQVLGGDVGMAGEDGKNN